MAVIKGYIHPARVHFPGCWRYSSHHLCMFAVVQELAAALTANMKWIGPPPTDKHSYDSVREAAWKLGQAALAKVSEGENNGD